MKERKEYICTFSWLRTVRRRCEAVYRGSITAFDALEYKNDFFTRTAIILSWKKELKNMYSRRMRNGTVY